MLGFQSADEERAALWKQRVEEKKKYDTITNRHALILKKRDLKYSKGNSADDIAKAMLEAEGFELEEEDEEDEMEEMMLLLGDGSEDLGDIEEMDPEEAAAKLLASEGFELE